MDKEAYRKGQEALIKDIKAKVLKIEEDSKGKDVMFDILGLLKGIKPIEWVDDFDGLARINDNLVIHYIEVNNSQTDDDDTEVVLMLELSCSFHGKHCMAYINPERFDDENSGSYANLETTTADNLHDSFCEMMEDDEWSKIRKVGIDWLVKHKYYSNCDTANNRAFN